MEVITHGRSHREMEQRLAALQTSLNVVKNSITKFENLIEDCWMVEEELRQIEEDEVCQEEEETANIEMVDEEEHGNPESSGPRMEANTRTSLRWSPVEIPSPQRKKQSSWMKHPNLRIWQLDLTAPGGLRRDGRVMSHIPEPPWARGGWDPTIGLYPSLTYPEVLRLSPPSPRKREVGRGKTVASLPGRA